MEQETARQARCKAVLPAAAKRSLFGMTLPQTAGVKIKRNEPCPCGSTIKAKRCCLKDAADAAAAERNRRHEAEEKALRDARTYVTIRR